MRIQELINYSENQKMNNKDYDCRGVFQSFKVKKVSKFQSLKVLKFQSFKVKKGKYQRRGTARRAPTNLEFQRIAVPLQIRNFNVLPCPYKSGISTYCRAPTNPESQRIAVPLHKIITCRCSGKSFRQKQWTADRGACPTIVRAVDRAKVGFRILQDLHP